MTIIAKDFVIDTARLRTDRTGIMINSASARCVSYICNLISVHRCSHHFDAGTVPDCLQIGRCELLVKHCITNVRRPVRYVVMLQVATQRASQPV